MGGPESPESPDFSLLDQANNNFLEQRKKPVSCELLASN